MSRPAEERLILYEGYGDNWKKLREDKGLTVRELAKETGISASTICSIENEIRQPTIRHINTYFTYFDISIDYLTGRSKAQSIDNQEICVCTGLSEKALRNIQGYNQYYNLNKMLEDFTFLKIMIKAYEELNSHYKPIKGDNK